MQPAATETRALRALFVRALLGGRCATVPEVYDLVSKWTNIPVNDLYDLIWAAQVAGKGK